jgi:hypothetical protein
MISLRDDISIRTTPEQLFRWLEAMPQEYKGWHPDHVDCRVIKGSMLQADTEVECREYLHGKLHSMRFYLTRIEPARRMEYRIAGLGRGVFEAIPKGDEIHFVAGLDLGSDIPIIGALLDFILRSLFPQRLSAMRQHMREEGRNLKWIIESGWQPDSA